MEERVDTASRLIQASPSIVYEAFAEPEALERWLPPAGMSAKVLAFDFREGGSYRMVLTYEQENHPPGKTSTDSDEVEVRFLKLVENRCIEQAVTFRAADVAYQGTMKMIWTFEQAEKGTNVTVRCENVPPGIKPEDHDAGLQASLANLAAYAEAAE